jgi:hypothetical protein
MMPIMAPFGHRLGGGGQPFVVAAQPAAAHDPAQRAFDHPAAGQDREALLVGGFLDDLDGHPQDLAGVGDQSAGVAAVGEHRGDRRHGEPQPLEHPGAAVAVLHAGGGDQHHQQQPEGVGHDVTFPPVDPFPGVIAATGTPDGVRALDRLGVHDPGRDHRVATVSVAQLLTQRVVDAVHGAVVAPALEIPVHRLPRRQVVGQLPPRAAGAQHVEDRVDDLAPRVFLVASVGVGRGQQRLDQPPLLVGHIGGISGAARAGGSRHGTA